MSAPPPGAARTSQNPGINFPGREAEGLKNVARVVLANCGVNYGPNRINRLVTGYLRHGARNGFAFFDFLANTVALTVEDRRRVLADPDVMRVLTYADPTGETAVARVMRGERR